MTILPWLAGGAFAGYAVGRGRRAALTHTWQRRRLIGDDFVSLDGELLEDGERAGSIRVIPVKRVNDPCAPSFQRLRRNFGNAPIYEVNNVMIEWRLQGKGHGKRFYLAAIEQLRKKHPRGFYLVSSSCGRGTTKPQALRVFNALSRQFPSTGKGWYRSLYIGPASGRGRRATRRLGHNEVARMLRRRLAPHGIYALQQGEAPDSIYLHLYADVYGEVTAPWNPAWKDTYWDEKAVTKAGWDEVDFIYGGYKIRISDHRQPRGGGYSMGRGERHGYTEWSIDPSTTLEGFPKRTQQERIDEIVKEAVEALHDEREEA